MSEKGILYLVATPIGNMEDITIRALKTLREVELIAAEDTRRTVKLLNRYHIKTPLTSYHEHNWKEKSLYLLRKLEEGSYIALVSDAGTPGISDPGAELVRAAFDKGIQVTVLPGACALIAGLVLSGFSTEEFIFAGFPSRVKKERMRLFDSLKNRKETLVFYEAPHRLLNTLRDINEVMGNRMVALARELTKVHEEVIRGSVREILDGFKGKEPRGEYVIIVEGRPYNEIIEEQEGNWREISIHDHYAMYLEMGYGRMDAMKKVASDRGLSKRDVYDKIKRSDKSQT